MHYVFVALLLKRLYRFYCPGTERRKKMGFLSTALLTPPTGQLSHRASYLFCLHVALTIFTPKFVSLFSVHRPRGLSHLASATQKRTLVASGAARCHFTSKRRLVLAVDIPPPRRGLLIGAKRPREGELLALVACATLELCHESLRTGSGREHKQRNNK